MKFSCIGILALALVGCGASAGSGSNGQTGLAATCRAPCRAPQLDQRVFLLASARGFDPLAGTQVRLSFHDGNLSVGAGCNSLGGAFSLQDERLVLVEGGVTEIGCDPPEQTQDEWLWSFIEARPKLTLQGSTLTLSGASAELVFRDREVADPDRPLVATPWSIDSFITGDAVSNFPLSADPTIVFAADGTLRFETGCNSGTASYTVAGNQLTLSMVGSTNRACTGPSAAAEEHILKVLRGDGTLSFEIQASRLTLQRGDVGFAAIAATGADARTGAAKVCEAEAGSELDVASEPSWRSFGDYAPVTNASGCLVRIDVVAERAGPEHCGWGDTRVLIVARPLGARYTSPADDDQYVRDPRGSYGIPALVSGFDASATLPSSARDTGYRVNGVELWVDPSDPAAVYMVRTDGVERWPRGEPPLCS